MSPWKVTVLLVLPLLAIIMSIASYPVATIGFALFAMAICPMLVIGCLIAGTDSVDSLDKSCTYISLYVLGVFCISVIILFGIEVAGPNPYRYYALVPAALVPYLLMKIVQSFVAQLGPDLDDWPSGHKRIVLGISATMILVGSAIVANFYLDPDAIRWLLADPRLPGNHASTLESIPPPFRPFLHVGFMFIFGFIVGLLNWAMFWEKRRNFGAKLSRALASFRVEQTSEQFSIHCFFWIVLFAYLAGIAASGYVLYQSFPIGMLVALTAGGSGYLLRMSFVSLGPSQDKEGRALSRRTAERDREEIAKLRYEQGAEEGAPATDAINAAAPDQPVRPAVQGGNSFTTHVSTSLMMPPSGAVAKFASQAQPAPQAVQPAMQVRIVCPSCLTVYEIPPSLLSVGRTARCARCGGEWVPAHGAAAPPA